MWSFAEKQGDRGAPSDDKPSHVFDYYLLFAKFDIAITFTLTDIWNIKNNSSVPNALLGLRKTVGVW